MLVRVLYLLAPLLVAAALSAVVHRYDLFPALARPLDGGASFRGERLFGDGKTWRGLAIAIAGSVVAVFVQKHLLAAVARPIALVDYAHASPLALGVAFGVGAIAGELPNSFVKRRLGIARGRTARTPGLRAVFWLWDQIDSVTLLWLTLAPWVRPTLSMILAGVLLALVLHPLVALAGFGLGARATAR